MDYLELISLPPKDTFNLGLTAPDNRYMVDLFGHTVKDGAYDKKGECTRPDNADFVGRLKTRNVGPFRATGLAPALDSLRDVLSRVKEEVPELYAILGTAGMHCSRYVKIRRPDGTLQIGPNISNHSWGTAIDITLNGVTDVQGNDKVQRGLLILSAYFNAAGWYWGAAFPTEDGMHFEASRSLVAKWKLLRML